MTQLENKTIQARSTTELDKKINFFIEGRVVKHISHSSFIDNGGVVTYSVTILLEKKSDREPILEG